MPKLSARALQAAKDLGLGPEPAKESALVESLRAACAEERARAARLEAELAALLGLLASEARV